MNKFKRNFIKDWASVYGALIFLTYVAGVLYWKRQENLWNQGKVAFEPDGPMGLFLFIVIPFGVTVLFVLVAFITYYFQKRKFNKSGKNYNHEQA